MEKVFYSWIAAPFFNANADIISDLKVEFGWAEKGSMAMSKTPSKNFKNTSCVTTFTVPNLVDLKSFQAEY